MKEWGSQNGTNPKRGSEGGGHAAGTSVLHWAARGRLLASPFGRPPTSEDSEGVKAGDRRTTPGAAALNMTEVGKGSQ